MDWTSFNPHGESKNKAFEVMCNILFEGWCRREYKERLKFFSFVNGKGGDGGVEAYGILDSGEVVAVQSKWFPDKFGNNQIEQIKDSLITALNVRPNIKRYIVCIPKDLTSNKNTKSNNSGSKTEDQRWKDLLNWVTKNHPSLIVNLWDETHIQKLLAQPDSMGLYEYWFNNSVLFENQIEFAFDMAKNSWAKNSYIPDIHTNGFIKDVIERFTCNYSFVEERYSIVKKTQVFLKNLINAYSELLNLLSNKRENALCVKIKTDIQTINTWFQYLKSIESQLSEGCDIKDSLDFYSFKLNLYENDLKDSSHYFTYYSHFSNVIAYLKNISRVVAVLSRFLYSYVDNRLIFLGNPGTGKTAGIVSVVSSFFQEKSHLPILIRAKKFSGNDSWLSILLNTLQLPNDWSIHSLFKALESSALILNKANTVEYKVCIQPKCVICVDGIDEAPDWNFWQEKIEEAKTFEQNFCNIKFIFLSRPYVFPKPYKLGYSNCIHRISNSGDVSVSELFDKYLDYYHIDICENYWIKGFLRTPLSLKLFCDLYQNRKIEKLLSNTIVLTRLFKEKINSLEEKYKELQKIHLKENYVFSFLEIFSNLTVRKKYITYQDINDNSEEPIKRNLDELLVFVSKEGFVDSRVFQKTILSAPVTMYSRGLQPAFDFLIASKKFDAIKNGDSVVINEIDGVSQMLSLLAIENDNKLLDQYENVKIQENVLFPLVCFALGNSSVEIASNYQDYVTNLMRASVNKFREIFCNIILPVSEAAEHPLGAMLLDKFLRSFSKPATRDIWWSIPANLKDSDDLDWFTSTRIDTSNITLYDNENYMGQPLILVWSLTSVNNNVRSESRLKLISWGIKNSICFYKLLSYCSDINDEQLIEDLFSVAYGIALGKNVESEYLKLMSDWIEKNVFSKYGLKKYENVVVRFYCLGIIKISIIRHVSNKDILKKITPPYNYKRCPELMPAYGKAFDSGRMSGFGPIDYDLSRYVLCDHLDIFFITNANKERYSKKADALLKKYKKKYNLSSLEFDSLIIAISYQFIKSQGWTKKEFGYISNEKIGVDSAISRSFFQATHGVQSKIMTVAEKYVWCARHRIEAFLANQLPVYNYYSRKLKIINDYSDIEDFVNPYQDYVNVNFKSHHSKFIHTDLVAKTNFDDFSIDNIRSWINQKVKPDFAKWIDDNQNETLIYAATSISNESTGIEENIWISSGLVKNDVFDNFIKNLNVYWESRDSFVNVADYHARMDSFCYCTPQEACTVLSRKECNSSDSLDNGKQVEIFKCVTESLTSFHDKTEFSFYMPSKILRNLTGIVYGDGYQYLNNNCECISHFEKIGDNWNNQQRYLLMNKSLLSDSLEKNKYKMFWLFRVQRNPLRKVYELLGKDFLNDTDRSFVVWRDGELFNSLELKNISPPNNSKYNGIENLFVIKNDL